MLCSALHTSGQLPLCSMTISCWYCLYLSLHTIVFPWLMHSFNNVRNFKYNRQWGQNSVIRLSRFGRKAISCWISKIYRSSISIGALCNLYARWFAKMAVIYTEFHRSLDPIHWFSANVLIHSSSSVAGLNSVFVLNQPIIRFKNWTVLCNIVQRKVTLMDGTRD